MRQLKIEQGISTAYSAEYIRRPTDKLEPDTFKKYKACLEHLKGFKKEIYFNELTAEMIEKGNIF